MGIGGLEFGSGVTRFPGLVNNYVGVWSNKISSLFARYIIGTLPECKCVVCLSVVIV